MLSFIESGKTRYVTQDNISKGVDAKDVADVAELFGVSQKIISDILGISIRAVQNKRRAKDNEKLDKNVSERLLRLREVMSVAMSYFDSEEGAKHWFNSPNVGLGK
jgi:putative toxin-antitoxin system antitoxin component (TIGR02293 family)